MRLQTSDAFAESLHNDIIVNISAGHGSFNALFACRREVKESSSEEEEAEVKQRVAPSGPAAKRKGKPKLIF